MDGGELKAQCKEFRRTLECGGMDPLENDFMRRFNGFVARHPHVLEWKNENGTTLLAALFCYLVHALAKQFPLATYQALVIQTPQVLAEKDGNGWTLLHFVCVWNPTALDIVSFFVQQNPDAAKVLDDAMRTPLHIACREKAPLPVIRVLVDANTRAIQICDCGGDPPLHEACHYDDSPLDVIQFLSMQKPHLCLHRNKNGLLPLDTTKHQRGGDHDNDIVEYMTTTTTAVARVLMERLSFLGPLPRELFEQVAAYVRGGPAAEVSVAVAALSAAEMEVLFRRGDVQTEFREQL